MISMSVQSAESILYESSERYVEQHENQGNIANTGKKNFKISKSIGKQNTQNYELQSSSEKFIWIVMTKQKKFIESSKKKQKRKIKLLLIQDQDFIVNFVSEIIYLKETPIQKIATVRKKKKTFREIAIKTWKFQV